MSEFKKIGKVEFILVLIGLIYAVLSTNPSLTTCSVMVPFVLLRLTWKTNESPLLFFALMMQWLAITVKVFYANYDHLIFNDIDLHRYPEEIVRAFYLALISLVAMAIGIHFSLRTYQSRGVDSMLKLSESYNKEKLIKLYVLSIILYPILLKLSFTLGGLQQPILKIIEYKWALFFIFMIYAFQNKSVKIFIIIFSIEFVLSLTGYFSAFKDYFLVIGITLFVIFKDRFKPIYLLPSALLFIVATYSILAWSYIKPVYRSYLSAGARQQVSVRSDGESLGKLFELTSSIDSTAIKEGFEATVNRISYIDFLSGTLSNVPSQVKHTDGTLWLGAIEKVLKPRLFFPEKEVIDDSEKTRLYTGSTYAGADQGTSISLGYYAESYVDFGEEGMVLVLFAFGLLIGLIYKYVMLNSPDKLVGTAFLIPFFFTIYSYEKALDKIFVALLLYLVVYFLVNRFALNSILSYLKN